MRRDRNYSRALRELAERVVSRLPEQFLARVENEDLVTSLVRQWLTHEGNAILVSRQEVRRYLLVTDGNGHAGTREESEPAGNWYRWLMRDWDFDADQLDDIFAQVNVGQGARFANRKGVLLRLWVDPKKGSRGIEPVEPAAPRQAPPRDFRKIAGDMIERCLGDNLPPGIKEELVASLARQWTTYDGQGMILEENGAYLLHLTENSDGGCNVDVKKVPRPLARNLLATGVAPDRVGDVLYRLNIGQFPEIRDASGRRFRLCADPRSRRVYQQPVDASTANGPMSFQFNVGFGL